MGAPTFRIKTLGCRVNRSDSLRIEWEFYRRGIRKSGEGEKPDFIVVNTCAVTSTGMRKSRKEVRRCLDSGTRVFVTGCAARLDPKTFERMGAGLLLHNGRDSVASRISEQFSCSGQTLQWESDGMTRAPIKVQDGCSRYCSYCVVPYLRGKPRSIPVDSVLRDVEHCRESSCGEIILCGIDLGSYEDPGGYGLADLLRRASSAAGDMWVRLSSVDPGDVTDELIDTFSMCANVCGHLHIPLQSGDRGVLTDMGRSYSPEQFREVVAGVSRIEDMSITTDVMVGFPTENEEAHRRTLELIDEVEFSRVHVFRYSPRPGTEASRLGDPVGPEIKKERSGEIADSARRASLRFHSRFIGRIIPVLVEGEMKSKHGCVFGRAQSFGGVVFPGGPEIIGRKVGVRIESIESGLMTGSMATECVKWKECRRG